MQSKKTENIIIKRINEVKGNLSQFEFAKEIGSSQSVISKILSGDPPSITVLTGIANKYNVSIDWLLGLSSRKSLKDFSSYDDTNPITYSDIIAFLIDLLKNNSVSFERGEQDCITINDHFIGDLVSSASSLLMTNPETIDVWLENTAKNYDIPLVKWTAAVNTLYNASIGHHSSLEILKNLSINMN